MRKDVLSMFLNVDKVGAERMSSSRLFHTMIGGWFGVAVMAVVTSTKLCCVEPGQYWDW